MRAERRTAFLVAAAMLACSPSVAAEGEAAGAAAPSATWCGDTHNVTGGGRASVVMKLYEGVAGGPTTLDAQWPDEGLYGRFRGAEDFSYDCAEGRICMQFSGALSELEAGGYPEGSSAAMLIALDLEGDASGGDGAYRIAPLPGFPAEQYGVLRLGLCEGV
jgi:hypothetical protein